MMTHATHLTLLAICLCLGFAPAKSRAQAAATAPVLSVTTVMENLRGPWDLAFAPDGAMLFTEKCHGLSVRLRASDLFCQGQSGVHGVVVDPEFAQGRRFVYVFSASNLTTGPRTNRVIRVKVAADWSAVSERVDILRDIAFKDTAHLGGPGAHSGGRLRFGPDGYLWITTGDNHNPTLPQDPKRLGGKVLRVDRDGLAARDNNAPAGFDPRIYTYGHRNPQGLAFRPADQPGAGQAFTAEHGPNHTDEVTPLAAGGNAGWDPRDRSDLDCVEGYCGYAGTARTMPMTDTQRFPKALAPAWNNQGKSQGMGPAEFLNGSQWKTWNGRLAVGFMRDQRLDVLTLGDAGTVTGVVSAEVPRARWRSLVQGPDGALWATTDNGSVVRIEPR